MDIQQDDSVLDSCSDEDEATPIHVYQHEVDDYTFVSKMYSDEYIEDGVHEITGSIMKDMNQVGSLKAWIIRRASNINMYSSCDSVSAELQLLSNVLFHQSGRLNKGKWHPYLNREQLLECSSGGLLNIDTISIKKEHRGHDLAFRFLQYLLNDLKGKWSLSVIVPGLTADSLEYVGNERKMKEDHVCQLFARLGFNFLQIESRDPYWYLIPSQMKQLKKAEVSDVRFSHLSN